ncbi:MAG: hypothetical protein ACU0CO_18285 [Shimia sp.]
MMFGLTRAILIVAMYLGFALIGIGLLSFLIILMTQGFLFALLTLGVVLSGVLLVVAAQMASAQIATAENTAQMLRLMRKNPALANDALGAVDRQGRRSA